MNFIILKTKYFKNSDCEIVIYVGLKNYNNKKRILVRGVLLAIIFVTYFAFLFVLNNDFMKTFICLCMFFL